MEVTFTNSIINPDYIFETSWEICNKVGGIYTVLSTKAPYLTDSLNDRYIVVGPDVWKETRENPDFIEDRTLFRNWRDKAESQGLRLRIGRWNVPGKPVAILVDFTSLFPVKDKILAEFWETYKLDSISGQWDYVEPVLFGYAAAKVIESFIEFNLSTQDNVVAHFHEWMTGSGVLYLKKNTPQCGLVFTTHATTIGRSIAGNNLPLYSNMESYNPDTIASRLGIRSRSSLEKLAANESDVFTTVSEITSREAGHFLGKKADILTPNGFFGGMVPSGDDLKKMRSNARKKIFKITGALLNQEIDDNSLLVISSGRYEFRNKGLDVFIDALGRINESNDDGKEIIAFITVPSAHKGPDAGLLERLKSGLSDLPQQDGSYLTHDLFNPDNDSIIQHLRKNNIYNRPEDKVKVIFVPSYLTGNDGIFNIPYYDLLTGFDLSVFPSYYEPWGYTPLESLAFNIPTVTTTLAGFGLWIQSKVETHCAALTVLDRNDENYDELTGNISSILSDFSRMSQDKLDACRKEAGTISELAQWKDLVSHYYDAYGAALDKVQERSTLFNDKMGVIMDQPVIPYYEKPDWKKVLIHSSLPESFKDITRLARNLWWSWQPDACELFRMTDPELWETLEHNPVALLESLSFNHLKELEGNKEFMALRDKVILAFNHYMEEGNNKKPPRIAYFSMEYGLHDSLKIFSGGLGVLAGDYLKEASDSNVDIIGVGLLYRYGYFKQSLAMNGDQVAEYLPQKFTHLPVLPVRDESGQWVTISLALPGRNMYAKVWKCDVGRTPLYLLDTDIEENEEQDRRVTHQLYGGDWENRFKQELLLGVGGIRTINALGIKPDVYHCNEGHAAFIGLERLRGLVVNENLTFEQALEVVRSSSLFTTHTPVPAGHDYFIEDILRTYIPHYADRLNISWERFMNLGRFNENNTGERFSMSVLAANLSQEMNGVSKIHGQVSREMFKDLYKGFFTEEIHIGHVTNGVHYPTWVGDKWREIHEEAFGAGFFNKQSDPAFWRNIDKISDERIWETRNYYRKVLIEYLRERVARDMKHRQDSPKLILKTTDNFRDDVLTIGFARRFATYKRAHLLFNNIERLRSLLSREGREVQFIFAGKAHPHDKAGQDLIRKIIEFSRMPEFIGRIIFVENYDMALATKLIQGVDVWLNTPTRPLEASGTSGEKAVMNGVPNLSVLDGWWAEGYKQGAGWALEEERAYENQTYQDQHDAENLYNIFEEDIIPAFYEKDENGIPAGWVSQVRNTFSMVAPHFTMKRMLDDYIEKYYNGLYERSSSLKKDNYKQAIRIAEWKEEFRQQWPNIEVVSLNLPDSTSKPLELGEKYKADVFLRTNGINFEDVGVEVIFGQKENDEVNEIIYKKELKAKQMEDGLVRYSCRIHIVMTGVFDYAFRIFPKNKMLPHRQDFVKIRWI